MSKIKLISSSMETIKITPEKFKFYPEHLHSWAGFNFISERVVWVSGRDLRICRDTMLAFLEHILESQYGGKAIVILVYF